MSLTTDRATDELPLIYYETQEDEQEENDSFVVDNETPAEDSDDPGALPIRSLTDFVIYDISDCNRLIPFAADLGEYKTGIHCASGVVAAWTEPSSDDLDSRSSATISEAGSDGPLLQRIRLSPILSVNVHFVKVGSKSKLELDP
jgi:hypothetical protein